MCSCQSEYTHKNTHMNSRTLSLQDLFRTVCWPQGYPLVHGFINSFRVVLSDSEVQEKRGQKNVLSDLIFLCVNFYRTSKVCVGLNKSTHTQILSL